MPERRASQLSAGGTHELLIAGLQSLLVRLPPAHDRMLPAAARGPRRRSVPHAVDPGSASGPHHDYDQTNDREEVVVDVTPHERRNRGTVKKTTKHTGLGAVRFGTRLR